MIAAGLVSISFRALSPRAVVDLVARHYPDPMPAGELLERFGLSELVRRQTGSLSGGQKRRLAVALALVGRPRLVLLDEPTTGLDVEARHELWTALRSFHAEGATVVVTSHYLEEIEALAERVVVVGQGRVLADDSLSRVLAAVARRKVLVHLPDDDAAHELARRTGSADPVREGDRLAFLAADSDAFVRELVRSGTEFSGLEVRGASLVFSCRVGGAWRQAGPVLDASAVSDEAGRGEHGSFTGAFVGMAAFDTGGGGAFADFDHFTYERLD